MTSGRASSANNSVNVGLPSTRELPASFAHSRPDVTYLLSQLANEFARLQAQCSELRAANAATVTMPRKIELEGSSGHQGGELSEPRYEIITDRFVLESLPPWVDPADLSTIDQPEEPVPSSLCYGREDLSELEIGQHADNRDSTGCGGGVHFASGTRNSESLPTMDSTLTILRQSACRRGSGHAETIEGVIQSFKKSEWANRDASGKHSGVRFSRIVTENESLMKFRHACCQRENLLESIMLIVIIANAIAMGASCDFFRNSKMWIVVDAIFATIFGFEWISKIFLFGCHGVFCGQDKYWNLFETCLTALGFWEVASAFNGQGTSGNAASQVRLIRLARVTKLLRLLRHPLFHDLVLILNGALGGMQTLGWSILLVTFPLFCLALVLRETVGLLENDDNFSTLFMSFFTVFRCVVGGECSDDTGRPIFVLLATNHGWQFAALYIITIFFMTFGLFNVITSIYIENTLAAARRNEMNLKSKRLQDPQLFKDKVSEMIDLVWSFAKTANIDKRPVELADLMRFQITPEIFQDLLQAPRFQEVLRELDVADEDSQGLFETLDVDAGGTLDLEELILGIHKLRGHPRRADVIGLSLLCRSLYTIVQKLEERSEERRP